MAAAKTDPLFGHQPRLLVLGYIRAFRLVGLYVMGEPGGKVLRIGRTADVTRRLEYARRSNDALQLLDVFWVSGAAEAAALEAATRRRLASSRRPDDWFAVDLATIRQAIGAASADIRFAVTPHERVIARVVQALRHIDGAIESMRDDGRLKGINREYRDARLRAKAAGKGFPTYEGYLLGVKLRLLSGLALKALGGNDKSRVRVKAEA